MLLSPERYEELLKAFEDAEDLRSFDAALEEEGPLHPLGPGQGRSRLDVSRHRIELRPAAARALRTVDPQDRPRLQGAIALLAQDPRPPRARSLQGRAGYRVRVGDYRILYTVEDEVLTVVVVTVGHSRDVYR